MTTRRSFINKLAILAGLALLPVSSVFRSQPDDPLFAFNRRDVYVCSKGGVDALGGGSVSNPLATVGFALGLGNTIRVMPGHVEDVGPYPIPVGEGQSIIGIRSCQGRPKFTCRGDIGFYLAPTAKAEYLHVIAKTRPDDLHGHNASMPSASS